jgi:hypothetical protein
MESGNAAEILGEWHGSTVFHSAICPSLSKIIKFTAMWLEMCRRYRLQRNSVHVRSPGSVHGDIDSFSFMVFAFSVGSANGLRPIMRICAPYFIQSNQFARLSPIMTLLFPIASTVSIRRWTFRYLYQAMPSFVFFLHYTQSLWSLTSSIHLLSLSP